MANIFKAKTLVGRTGLFSHEVIAPNLVFNTGNQIISGNKTFLDNIIVSGAGIFNNLNLNSISSLNISGVDVYITDGIVYSNQQIYSSNLIYNTGNQNIAGIKNFYFRPTVNSIPVLLSGEPNNVIYTTGDQIIFGNKTFANNIEVQGTGIFNSVDLSNISEFQFSGVTMNLIDTNVYISGGWIYISGNPVLTGVDLSPYATTTNLALTGSSLNIKINSLSGYINSSDSKIVFTTGNQIIFGDKTFVNNINISGTGIFNNLNLYSRPTVNTIPVLLSGENANGLSVLVKNDEPATLLKGQPVYIYGANGNNILVRKASNTGEAYSSKTLGLLAQDLNSNAQGFVITEGALEGLDISAGNAGDPVWLGPTGNLIFGLTNKPYAPNHLVYLGVVERKQANNGKIYVKIQNGFELEELHNVNINHTYNLNNNDILRYDSISGIWFNRSLDTGIFQTRIDALSGSAVLTFGNQNVGGNKTFTGITTFSGQEVNLIDTALNLSGAGDITFSSTNINFINSPVFISGANLRVDSNILISGNPVLTGVNLSSYATITNLALTGSILSTSINSLSGIVTGDYVTKTNGQFTNRPTVNGTGVLLIGEGGGSTTLPDTLVYTTGNQTISGVKNFTDNLVIKDSLFQSSQASGYLTGVGYSGNYDGGYFLGRTKLSQNTSRLVDSSFGNNFVKILDDAAFGIVKINSDGKYQIALGSNRPIYTSNNYGNTWSASSSISQIWSNASISSDGKYQIARGNNQTVYISKNYGNTWSSAGISCNSSHSISSDGKYIVVLNGPIKYVSEDYGNSWVTKSVPIGTRISISSDGKYQTISYYNPAGKIYVSTDYGNTWTEKTNSYFSDNISMRYWRDISISSDGKYQVCVADLQGIYVSNNYGETWDLKLGGSLTFASVSISSDGKYQVATSPIQNRVYVSSDYGNTWIIKESTLNWNSVSISSDGKYIAAGAYNTNGGIWISKTDELIDGNLYADNLIYNTGNQTISGTKTFSGDGAVLDFTSGARLLVSGVPVLTGARQDPTAVLTYGNQIISGNKTFAQTGSFNTLQITNKKLSSYSLNSTNFVFGDNYLNFANSSSNIIGILPSGIVSGINYYAKNLNSGIFFISGSGSRTIDGFSTLNLYRNESVQLVGVNSIGYTGWVTISADGGIS